MSNRCRRCPDANSSIIDDRSLSPRADLAAKDPDEGFRVVVVAGDPARLVTEPDSPGADLDWQDAVVAIASAVMERGGRLVTPANVELVGLLAQATLPHARAHAAERTGAGDGPVEAIETGGASVAGRRLLAPYAHRNGLTLLDRDRQPVPLDEMPAPTEYDGENLLDAEHHPLVPDMMDRAIGAVVIHPDDRIVEETYSLRGMDRSRIAVIGSSWTSIGSVGFDPVHDLLGDDPEFGLPGTYVPYTLLMELLVDGWLRERPRGALR